MKTKMKIFNVIFALTMLVGAVRADDLSACDGYEYFSPAFALCTVHAYNIGDRTNPTSGARTAEMNDVIALKSTVIAQQLKEQYDILNTMIKRFKTQLEKAVLTSKIEVLTGNSSSASGASSSSSNNNGLSNAEDCYDVMDRANVYDCFARNLSKIATAADNDTTNARKQLDNDLNIMKAYEVDTTGDDCKSRNNKNDIKKCVQYLQVKVRMAKSDYDLKYRQSRYPY